ncbi:MAG TPA: Asp23/Gls24 family envelope stress response protein [Gaiellaceae bacterium]
MTGRASISSEVLARYAADAAREIEGVRGLVASQLHRHRGVRVSGEDGAVTVELHLDVDWGAELPTLGRDVQQRVLDYLERMAGSRPAAVNVVIDAVGPAR